MKYKLLNCYLLDTAQIFKSDRLDYVFIVETLYLKRKFRIYLTLDIYTTTNVKNYINGIVNIKSYNSKERI